MRCYICNCVLETYDIQQDDEGKWLPCRTCQGISNVTAVVVNPLGTEEANDNYWILMYGEMDDDYDI